MNAHKQNFAAGARIGLNQGPCCRWNGLTLLFGVLGIAKQEAGVKRVVHRLEAFNLLFKPFRQTIPSHAQVCKLSVTTEIGQRDGREHRVFGAGILERTVAVPKLIGNIANNFGMLTIGHLTIDLDV